MGYKMFDGKNLLKRCRYMNGRGELEALASAELDYNHIDNWRSIAQEWGYLELPEPCERVLRFIGKRPCLYGVLIRILIEMHYPFLQCQALLCLPKIQIPSFIERCLTENVDNSIIWACLEIWFLRLRNEGEKQRYEDIAAWLNDNGAEACEELVDLCRKHGRIKTLIQWLFSNGHHGWPEVSGRINLPKSILFLIEGAIAYGWDDKDFDKEFKDIEYLTFVVLDVKRDAALRSALADVILDIYKQILAEDNGLSPYNSEICRSERVKGFATAFKIVNSADLVVGVKEIYDQHRYYFEGYRGRAAKHDFRHLAKMDFIMDAVEVIAQEPSLAASVRGVLMDMTDRERRRSRSQ